MLYSVSFLFSVQKQRFVRFPAALYPLGLCLCTVCVEERRRGPEKMRRGGEEGVKPEAVMSGGGGRRNERAVQAEGWRTVRGGYMRGWDI